MRNILKKYSGTVLRNVKNCTPGPVGMLLKVSQPSALCYLEVERGGGRRRSWLVGEVFEKSHVLLEPFGGVCYLTQVLLNVET